MGLVHVINVILLLAVESVLSGVGVLVLKNLCQNSFSVLVLSSLNIHSSSMHSVELIFDIS